MQAKDLMVRQVVTVRADASLAEAARVLLAAGINGAPVVDESGRLVGMIGLKDILRAPSPAYAEATVHRYMSLEARAQAIAATRVAQVMARQVISVSPATPAAEVVALLVNRGRHPIPVIANGAVVGVLGRADVVRAILAQAPPGSADAGNPEVAEGV